MSAWTFVEDSLSVAGGLLLTFGTGAQAWAQLTEYRDLFRDLPEATRGAVVDKVANPLRATITSPGKIKRLLMAVSPGPQPRALMPLLLLQTLLAVILDIPGKLAKIREGEKGDVAERAAKVIRLAAVWAVLMAGSELLLAVAIIQLVLAFN